MTRSQKDKNKLSFRTIFLCRKCDIAIMQKPLSACKRCPFNPNQPKPDEPERVEFT